MTEQYQQLNINGNGGFLSRIFLPSDPIIPPFPFPSQFLPAESQLAIVDTQAIAGIVILPLAAAAGVNAEIAIVAENASSFPLTITGSGTDTFLVPAGIVLVVSADNVSTTFRSNGVDTWVAVSQST